MSEFERDHRLAEALAGIGDAVAAHVHPPGADAVYATVRQRRRNRVVAAGALALTLLAGSAVGVAVAGGGPPPIGGEPTATAPPSRTPDRPSPSASATRGTPSTTSGSGGTAPDGRISLAELKAATLDIPRWPAGFSEACPAGTVRLVGGRIDGSGSRVEIVRQPVYADVDADGAQETAVIIRCGTQGADYKVLVLDRSPGGKIRTLAQVLGTAGSTGVEGRDVLTVWDIAATGNRQIRVDVGEYRPCCGMAPDLPQHQWRTYGFDGSRFRQTAGPTAFGPNPKITDLTVTSGDLVMTKQADGAWRGTLTVKVRNAGPFAAHASVYLNGTAGLAATGTGWASCIGLPEPSLELVSTCELGRLDAGASRTLTLAFTSAASPAGTCSIVVAHTDDEFNAWSYPDLNGVDNRARVAVRAG